MNIAIIIRRLDVKGGAQRQALSLAVRLRERGNGVRLYTFVFDKAACYGELLDGFEVIVDRDERGLAARINVDTEILNPHGEEAYRVAAYFKKRHPRAVSVWMMNDMATRYPSYLRAKEVDPNIRKSLPKIIVYKLLDWYEKVRFISKQDRITVLDNRDRDWVRQYYQRTARVVRTGVDVTEFNYTEHDPPRKQSIKILASGIFFAHRRFEDVIRALKSLRDEGYMATLSIVGGVADRAYKKEIDRLIEELNLEGFVKLLGVVSDEELKDLYRSYDVFILSSHMQSWGIAVFEALASGIPVIVSKTAGASEVLTDGEHALVVPPKSPERIAAAVVRLVNDSDLYRRLSRSGSAFVRERISWVRYADAMVEEFLRATGHFSDSKETDILQGNEK